MQVKDGTPDPQAHGAAGGPAVPGTPEAVLQALEDRDFPAAERALEALRLGGGDPILCLILSSLFLVRMGELYSALRALRAAEEHRPDCAEIHDLLSIYLARLGQQTDSLFHSKMAVASSRHFPGVVLPPEWLGTFADAFLSITERVLWKEGKEALAAGLPTLARRRFVEAADLDRRDPRIWTDLARVSLAEGAPLSALRAAEAVVSLEQDKAENQALYAQTLMAVGRHADARAAIAEALSLAPRDPDIAGIFVHLNGFTADATPPVARAFAEAWRGMHGQPGVQTGSDPAPMQGRGRVGILSAGLNGNGRHASFLATVEQALYRVADLTYYPLHPLEDNTARRLQRTAARWFNLSDVDDETAAFILSNENLDCLIDLDGFLPGGRPGIVARADVARIWSPFATPGAGPRADGTSLLDPFCPVPLAMDFASLSVRTGLSTWSPYRGILPEVRSRRFAVRGDIRIVAVDGDLALHGPETLARLQSLASADGNLRFRIGRRFLRDQDALELFLKRLAEAGLDLGRLDVLPDRSGLDSLLAGADGAVAAWPAADPAFLEEAVRYGVPVALAAPLLNEQAGGVSLLGSNGLGDAICPADADFAMAALDWFERWAREDDLRKRVFDLVDAVASGDGSYDRGQSFLAFLTGQTKPSLGGE